jgi:hypothetical protein
MDGYTEARVDPTVVVEQEQEDEIAEALAETEVQPIETVTDDSGYTQARNPQLVQPARAAPAQAGPSPQGVQSAFVLEKQDPKHRMGNYLQILMEAYSALKPKPKPVFFSWVDGINVTEFKRLIEARLTTLAGHNLGWWSQRLQDFQRGVKYKDIDRSRYKYLIKVSGGMLTRRGKINDAGKWIDTQKMEPFSTTGLNSHWSGDGWAMWVESRNKDFYTNRMKLLRLQHTSFLSGDKVMGAGEWQVENGVLKKISGRSGHYQPTLDHLLQAMRDLEIAGVVPVDNVDVVVYSRLSNVRLEMKWRDLKTEPQPNRSYKVDPQA